MTEPTLIGRLRDGTTLPEKVSVADVESELARTHEYSWKITYHGAQCKFESPDKESGIIYDLKVPAEIRGRGIGTAMVNVAESTLKENTNAQMIYASVGAPTEATEHVLAEKCGYEINGITHRTGIGRVVEAEKALRQ